MQCSHNGKIFSNFDMFDMFGLSFLTFTRLRLEVGVNIVSLYDLHFKNLYFGWLSHHVCLTLIHFCWTQNHQAKIFRVNFSFQY